MSDNPSTPAEEPWVRVYCSREFPAWLAKHQVSLACSTYQTGKLFFFGLNPQGALSVHERTFERCMGLWSNGQTLWMSSRYQLWRFENVLQPGQPYEEHDRLFVPKVGHTTGEVDVHDVMVDADGRVIFACTQFNCLAGLHDRDSFAPLWTPPFISRLVAEDRCHLNGIAHEQGRPRYVTVVSTSDVIEGWRDHRAEGGAVIDLEDGSMVLQGLSMPHSPRVHQERLWLLNSGHGYLGYVEEGSFKPLTFCPGYLRGLAFVGDYAVVGLSMPRHERTFAGLPLERELQDKGAEPRCGLMVIDLKDGTIAHWLRFEGMVTELYDVIALPGARRPMALGFRSDEIRRIVTVSEMGSLLGPADSEQSR